MLTALAFGLRLATMRDSLMGDELFIYSYVHDQTLGHALHLVREREKTPPLIFIADWVPTGPLSLGRPLDRRSLSSRRPGHPLVLRPAAATAELRAVD
jgi:hypothetical protein